MPAPSSSPALLRRHLTDHDVAADDVHGFDLADLDLPGLLTALAALMDFRGRRGRRHSLLPILVLAVWAVAAGATSYVAIADHARYATTGDLTRIGFTGVGVRARRGGRRSGIPSMATIRRVLLGIDAPAFEAALTTWACGRARCAEETAAALPARDRRPDRARRSVISLDGKVVRGSRRTDAGAVALLAALHIGTGLVLTQTAIISGNEIAALATALTSLAAVLDLAGVVIVADALHCQRSHAAFLLAAGAHYVFRARDNQPTLAAFAAAQHWRHVPRHTTWDRGHARIETRTIQVMSFSGRAQHALAALFPGAVQIIKIHRRRSPLDGPTTAPLKPIKAERATVYLVTSLTHHEAPPALLAEWIRAEWQIENKIHHVRDVTYREDASRIRTGSGPQVMVALRNTGINLAHLDGQASIAGAHREYAATSSELLDRVLAA